MTQKMAETVLSVEIIVRNRHGLHLRCANELSRLANRFTSVLQLTNGQKTVNAKSMLGVITLAAGEGARLKLTAKGDDASEAVAAVLAYFTSENTEK